MKFYFYALGTAIAVDRTRNANTFLEISTMLHNRSATIDTILTKRKQQAARLEQTLPAWKKLRQTVEDLTYYWQTKAPTLDEGATRIDFSSTLYQIDQQLQAIARLSKRLGRDSLNIGVLGEMGQGKSQLLRSITSASEAIIPTSDDGVCTSAISKIYNEPGLSGVRAEIDFYTWESFRDEVIGLYYQKLGISAPIPQTQESFKRDPFPALPPHLKDDENAKRLYGHFRKDYHLKFEQYRSNLDQPTLILTKPDEIRKFVTHSGRNIQGDRLSYDNIAVREARIFYAFPEPDLGRIGLVDLPGTGDNSIYDAERLIKAVEQDVDFILFVRKVESIVFRPWNESERSLVTTAQRALADFSLSECSFAVLNRFRTKDADEDARRLEVCNQLQATAHQDGIEVLKAVVVDCTNSDIVKQKLIDPALEYLVKQIDRLYETTLQEHDRLRRQCQKDIGQKLAEAQMFLAQQSNEDDTFQPWFEGTFWRNLTTGLRQEQTKLWNMQSQEDKDFKAKVQDVLKQCQAESVIPSIDEIIIKSADERSYKVAYYQLLLLMRKTLTDHFEGLGYTIEQLLEQVRSSIVTVLVEQAGLKNLSNKQGSAFLLEMAEQLPTRHLGLKSGFEKIMDLKTSAENPEKWVELVLEELDPDRNLDPLSQEQMEPKFLNRITQFWDGLSEVEKSELCQGAIDLLQQAVQSTLDGTESLKFAGIVLRQVLNAFGQAENHLPENQQPFEFSNAEKIQQALINRRDQVVTQCAEILNSKLTEPNKTAYSMFIRFVGQILADDPDIAKNVKLQWRIFLATKQDLLLDSSEPKIREEVRKNLKQYMEKALEANQAERL
jgi:hypothetical protein